MKLAEIMQDYPRIRLATAADQERILEIIDATAIQTSDLQVSFDRRPDYFAFFPSQADEAFVFLFLNKDGTAHGLAVLSFRDYVHEGRPLRMAYGSDLRVMSTLERAPRIEWRRLYGVLVGSLPLVDEFKGAEGTSTAVWDDNSAAQRAFVDSKKDRGFTYRALMEYSSFSIWGRRPFARKTRAHVRRATGEDRTVLREILCADEPGRVAWSEKEISRTLQTLGKTWNDFFLLEENGRVTASVLPCREDDRRSLKVKSMPLGLRLVGRLLPLFGRPGLEVGDRMRSLSLLFFRSRDEASADRQLIAFCEYFWTGLSQVPRKDRFHVILFSGPRSMNLAPGLRRHGFLFSRIDGKVFEVAATTDNHARPLPNLDRLEVGLL